MTNCTEPNRAACPRLCSDFCNAKEVENARRSAADCSPLRVAYSRAELAVKLKDWMIELWGDSPKNLDPEQRDQWHRDNGLIYHFICDHFPAENDQVELPPNGGSESKKCVVGG